MGNAQSFASCCQAAASVDAHQETLPEATPVETQKDAPAVAEPAKTVESAEEVKEAVKEPAKEDAQEPAKEAVQEPAKEAVQEPAKEAAQEPAKEAAQEHAKEPVQEEAKEAVQEPAEAVKAEEVKETAAAPVEAGSFTITFELKGKTTEVKFEKRPLGFVFGAQKKGGGCCSGGAETGKYVVTKVEKKGLKEVKVGMVIKKINDTEVPDKKEWVELQEMMALAAKPLPEEEAATAAPAPTKQEDAPIQDVTAKAPEAAPAAPEQAAPEASPEAAIAAAPEQAPEAAKATEPTAAPEVKPEAAKASEPEAAKAEPAIEPAAAATA